MWVGKECQEKFFKFPTLKFQSLFVGGGLRERQQIKQTFRRKVI